MAHIKCDFFSEALECSASIHVIMPQQPSLLNKDRVEQEKYPCLYLLHGLSDDHTIWSRFTSIERYASSLGIAVIMPAVGRSWYTDMAYGQNYFTYISKELPRFVQSMFPVSAAREDTYIAGLSMGGYGALKTAMRYPDKYGMAASLSGAVDMAERIADFKNDFPAIFGDRKVRGSEDDLFYLAEKLSESSAPKPFLYLNCGREDHLHASNLRFRDHCERIQLDVLYEEFPGTHEWGYWDEHIQRVLGYFFKDKSIMSK
ncbi:alpha/beta hydrolase [Pseudalkalibacillus sp. Hm43]|uniref:alpha/beta hydrolase n=1 Tax=Pseudalkalibacillus sp. Hm43 TaxID=3450742 RepID=UPI003F41B925